MQRRTFFDVTVATAASISSPLLRAQTLQTLPTGPVGIVPQGLSE